jgi:phosphoserine aminotransferase
MTRAYNFSAGPAIMPDAVIQRIRDDLPEYGGAGASVMEISHRSRAFVDIAEKAERDLRELLGVPDDHRVLFLQGGATTQFALAPMNLLREGETADYVVTGQWGKKAHTEGARLGRLNLAADTAETGYTHIPPVSEWRLSRDAAYLHYTPNETIAGVEFHEPPAEVDAPLVADFSSTILSRPLDVSRFGLIYAGAQKNMGPAGLCVLIIRDDVLSKCRDDLPAMFSYRTQVEKGSMFNTPNTFAWYVAGLVFEWLKEQGGLEAMGERNRRKAAMLYEAIDGSDFYSNPVDPDARSWMNVPFTLADPALDPVFLEEAESAGFQGLKGHRSVGGIRASLYNAMDIAGVEALVDFMKDFEKRKA